MLLRFDVDQRLRQRELRLLREARRTTCSLHLRLDLALELELQVRLRPRRAGRRRCRSRCRTRARIRVVERGHDGRARPPSPSARTRAVLAGDFLAVIVGGKRERERLASRPRSSRRPPLRTPAASGLRRARSRSPSPARRGTRRRRSCPVKSTIDAIARPRAARDRRRSVVRCWRSTSSVRSMSSGVDFDLRPLDGDVAKGRRPSPRDRPRRSPRTRARRARRSLLVLRLDPRIAGDAQVLLAHRVVEARLDRIGDDVGAHLRAVLLRDHLERHLAGTKSRHLDVLREPRQPLLDFALDLRRRARDMSAGARVRRGFPDWFACGSNPC